MNRFMVMAVAVVMLAAGGFGAEVPTYVAGSCDVEVARLLKHATSSLVLGKTSLRTLAPQYCVDMGSATNWSDALSQVDRLYGTNSLKRALYLWKFIRPNMPTSVLSELRLERSIFSFSSGSGQSASYVLDPGDTAPPSRSAPPGTNVIVRQGSLSEPSPKATLDFWISHGDTIIVGAPSLMLHNFVHASMCYQSLQFDTNETLTFFWGSHPMTNGARGIYFNGSMTSLETNYCSTVYGNHFGNTVERLEFNPDLTIKRRTVYDSIDQPKYADFYEHGKLVRRGFYGRKEGARNCWSYYFDHFEEFKSSDSKPDTR